MNRQCTKEMTVHLRGSDLMDDVSEKKGLETRREADSFDNGIGNQTILHYNYLLRIYSQYYFLHLSYVFKFLLFISYSTPREVLPDPALCLLLRGRARRCGKAGEMIGLPGPYNLTCRWPRRQAVWRERTWLHLGSSRGGLWVDDVSGTARLVRENDLRLKEYEGTNAFYRIFFYIRFRDCGNR